MNDLFSQALFASDQALPPALGLKTWNGSDPAARFAVYRNNVFVSLVDALADRYPVVLALVGEDFFRAMAGVFARQTPPTSRVMACYGESFAEFIEGFSPAAALPYLADVARLESLHVAAYHAADAQALDAKQLAERLADPEQLPGLRVIFQPSLRLLRSRYAVLSLWAAHQGLLDIATVDPTQPESVLIVRPQFEVEMTRISAAAADFVACLLAGANLGDALEEMTHGNQTERVELAEQLDFALSDTLALLFRSQAVAALATASPSPVASAC